MHEPLRILHLIDSLALGGAERVAVNLFHSLNAQGPMAWLCASRKEGPLKALIRQTGQYTFLGKRHTADLLAFGRLIRYIRSNRIQIIHAHSSSLAWAVVVKWMTGIGVVWHNHNGGSTLLPRHTQFILRLLCRWADHVVSVNQPLAEWAVTSLSVPRSKVTYLPNFPDLSFPTGAPERQHQNPESIILCVANLRFPKDHSNLVAALEILHKEGRAFKAWLVGKDFHDAYSVNLKSQIAIAGLKDKVQLLGDRTDIAELLQQADIGVLPSASEGLPVALLEYGLAGLPVVSTEVGECGAVLGSDGIVVPPGDSRALAKGLSILLVNPDLRKALGHQFTEKVRAYYSAEAVLNHLLNIYIQVRGARGNRA